MPLVSILRNRQVNEDDNPERPMKLRKQLGLPLPATSSTKSDPPPPKKSTRIDGSGRGLRVHWGRFKKKIGTNSAFSESLDMGIGDSGTDTSHSHYGRSEKRDDGFGADDDESTEVETIVVDNTLGGSLTQPSELGTNPEKSAGGGSHPGTAESTYMSSHRADGIWENLEIFTFLRWRLWPFVVSFFATRFFEESKEQHYSRETYYQGKTLMLYSTLFIILNWILVAALAIRPLKISDNIMFFGIDTVLTIPLPFLVIFDLPRRRPIIYQTFLTAAIWTWSYYTLAFMYACSFYQQHGPSTCGKRDFIGLFYYGIALPTIAMFGLRQNRFCHMLGALGFVVLYAVLIGPFREGSVRNILNFIAFHGFVLYIHYKRETTERRLFSLRDQLKIQYRAKQKAQVNERKAADSKRRLTSYVFHEVRVPLNTALLAVQNLQAAHAVPKDLEIEWAALEGSLSMMSKVLNDVLDFNRMDSGRFSTVSQPYNLHQAMKSMFVPLKLAADARGLELQTVFDHRIDEVARYAALKAQGLSETSISRELQEKPEETGLVVGDEMRLRQIVTNLTSNACKFTRSGGQIRVQTELIQPVGSDYPVLPMLAQSAPVVATPATEKTEDTAMTDTGLSISRLSAHNASFAQVPNQIVVRIEVHDTGVGIRPRDLEDNQLFSPYIQTEIGKYQGGKGTGLGLALVRRIVKLSGGRLGVKSKLNEGSTFWVELALGIGAKALTVDDHPDFTDSGESQSRASSKTPIFQLKDIPQPKSRDFALQPNSQEDPPEQRPPINPIPSQAEAAMKTLMEHSGLVGVGKSNDAMAEAPETALLALALGERVGQSQSTFSPLMTPPPDPDGHKPPSPNISRKKAPLYDPPLDVLVVDDDALTRRLMTRMLSRLGCNVDTAENGKVALDKILESCMEGVSSYAVIFLDNQMPIMSGLDTVAKLREARISVLVVGVTGNALLSDQEEYIAAGVDQVLTKPVLEKSLREFLDLGDSRRRKQRPSPSVGASFPDHPSAQLTHLSSPT